MSLLLPTVECEVNFGPAENCIGNKLNRFLSKQQITALENNLLIFINCLINTALKKPNKDSKEKRNKENETVKELKRFCRNTASQ